MVEIRSIVVCPADGEILEVVAHDVAAVARAVQPALHHVVYRALPGCDIFPHGGPVVAGGRYPMRDLEPIGPGMAEEVVVGHILTVALGGFIQLALVGEGVSGREMGCTAGAAGRPGCIDLRQHVSLIGLHLTPVKHQGIG